ncbi:MAG TPA: carboxypeptidase regulatory-like domain-containing protein [Candidatus Angelobacter sp.]|nr:carboxypeptidase regulatory-like domain-containing protein [Candidatus Angelobacter sp.]
MTRLFFLLSIFLAVSVNSISQSGPNQVVQSPFQAGVTHSQGRYGFTQDNFLVEGAQRIRDHGSNAIFIYLDPLFRVRYPDKSNAPSWPAADPTTLTELAQSAPAKKVLDMPFKTFVITAYSFANGDDVDNFAVDPDAAGAEEQEFYDLTRYLYKTYAGTGKTFILKHWEGDYTGLQGFDTTKDIAPNMVDAMNIWLKARQRGISRARSDSGSPAGVGVFHAVEAVRVLDYSRSGLTRVINAIIPVVKPDMVTYSSYDSSLAGSDDASTRAAMNEALNVIKSLAPDPLGLGDKRIVISEYGLFENELPPSDTGPRTTTILQTSQASGIFGAFFWQIFDNECHQSDGVDFPADSSLGDPIRPVNSQCRGLWLVRPDGTFSPLKDLVSRYFNPSTSGTTLTGRVTSAASDAGIGGASVSFFGGRTTADSNGNFSLPNVPAGDAQPTQLTASAPGFQNFSVSVNVTSGQNSPVNFPLIPSNAAGSITGRVTSAVNGSAMSGASVTFSGGSTTTNSNGEFTFSAVPGGTYSVKVQSPGFIPVTTAIKVQPAIATVLKVRLPTGAKLTGRVTNSSGAAVAGATVNVHGGLVSTNVSVLTNATGNYDSGWLSIGSYQAVATATGFGATTAAATLTTGAILTQNLVLIPPQPDFDLAAWPGVVTAAAGARVDYTAHVTPLRGFNSPVTFSVTGLPPNTTASFNPTVIGSGSSILTVNTTLSTPPKLDFSTTPPTVAPYLITITGTGGGLQRTTKVSLTVSAPTKGAASGRVTRASDGTGIAGAKISTSLTSVIADQNGNFTLTNQPPGSLSLTASATGFNSLTKAVTITAGQTTPVNFSLTSTAATGSITGRITSAVNGTALSGATVTFSRGSTVSDANGNYTFKAVPPGTYTITAVRAGFVPASVTATVASSAVTANIRIATGGKIAGKVVNRSGVAISGASVRIVGGLVPTTITVLTNSTGVYNSNWIAVGTYTVQVSKPGFATQTKTTSMSAGATATVNFTLQ